MVNVADIFKTLSDLTRLRLVCMLCAEEEVCVCHLANAMKEPGYKISRHLSLLKAAGLVVARRKGTWMYYRLSEARSDFDSLLREFLLKALDSLPQVREDLKRLHGFSCEVQ